MKTLATPSDLVYELLQVEAQIPERKKPKQKPKTFGEPRIPGERHPFREFHKGSSSTPPRLGPDQNHKFFDPLEAELKAAKQKIESLQKELSDLKTQFNLPNETQKL